MPTREEILAALPQQIGATYAVQNGQWMNDPWLQREVERRGFVTVQTTPVEVTLRRDLWELRA